MDQISDIKPQSNKHQHRVRNWLLLFIGWIIVTMGGMRLYFGPDELHVDTAKLSFICGMIIFVGTMFILFMIVRAFLLRLWDKPTSLANRILDYIKEPRNYFSIVAKAIIAYVLIILLSVLIKDGTATVFSITGWHNVILPMMLPAAMILVLAVPVGINLLIMGHVNRYWIAMAIGNIVVMGSSLYNFFQHPLGSVEGFPVAMAQKAEGWSALFSVPFLALWSWLIIRQLLGKTKAIEGQVAERDEREKTMTARAARNAFLFGFLSTMACTSVFSGFPLHSFSGVQVADALQFTWSMSLFIFSISLLKYNVR